MVIHKEFKSPVKESVRVMSQDGFFIEIVYKDWTPIRQECWKDAYANGCISQDMHMIGADPEQSVALERAKEAAFENRVREIMIELINNGDPEDLDAKGRPKVDVIGEELGSLPSAYLRNKLFAEITKNES